VLGAQQIERARNPSDALKKTNNLRAEAALATLTPYESNQIGAAPALTHGILVVVS